MSATRTWRWALQAGLVWTVTGCGGGDRGRQPDTTAMSTVPADTTRDAATARVAAPAATDSATGTTAGGDSAARAAASEKQAAPAKPAAAAPKPATGGAQSPQLVALGDSIFHGQVAGGTCTACHGQDAKGTAVAPNLTDSEWLNGDGSYDFIVQTITTGVPKPKQHPAPMPPRGGATLTDDQVKAVAAYVYSLSHKS